VILFKSKKVSGSQWRTCYKREAVGEMLQGGELRSGSSSSGEG
jgi:hypothetical protein